MPGTRGRRTDGFYFVVVDGVPQYCQWQELKDYLRESAKVRPGHTNVVKVNEDGTRVGFCPLPNKAEANRAFEYLVAEGWRGLDVRVSLVWKSDLNSEEIERKRGPEQSRRRRLPSAATVPPFPSNMPRASRLPALPHDLNALPYAMNTAQGGVPLGPPSYLPYMVKNGSFPSQTMPDPMTDQQHMDSLSVFSDCPSLGPASASATEFQDQGEPMDDSSRLTIRISRVPNETKREDLADLLKRYGRISSLDIGYDQKQQYSAAATYEDAAAAALALRELNGKYLGDLALEVQYEHKDGKGIETSKHSAVSDSVSPGSLRKPASRSGPLVVDGARGQVYSRRRQSDDDSESFEGTSSADENCACQSREALIRNPRQKRQS